MEWHAADGSVISEAEWNAQAEQAAATPEPAEAPPGRRPCAGDAASAGAPTSRRAGSDADG